MGFWLTSFGFSGGPKGVLYTFESASIGSGAKNTTLTFARVVFTTNTANIANDGDDIFSGLFNPGQDGIFNEANASVAGVSFGGAAVNVNVVPEPATSSILAVSLGVLLLAGARKRASSSGAPTATRCPPGARPRST